MQTNCVDMLTQWLNSIFSVQNIHLIPLEGDAGFRRYFRFSLLDKSYIAVDAPPDKSNNLAFVAIALALKEKGICVPEIIASDLTKGFICLSDLGNNLLSDALNEQTMLRYYQQAITQMIEFSDIKFCGEYQLPDYDEKFVRLELSIFTDWLLEKHLAISLSEEEQQKLNECFDLLVSNSLQQPKVFMHRDYHSRNLMLTDDKQLAVIDFQDAVYGPITYDAVSLLRDCYVKWPTELIRPLFSFFVEQVSAKYQLNYPIKQWQRWFDLQGMQRHIKASGIFARLHHRDGKSGYLKDIPLTLSYIVDIAEQYPELNFLAEFVSTQVIPALNNKQVNP